MRWCCRALLQQLLLKLRQFQNPTNFLSFHKNTKSIAYWILMTNLILSVIKAHLQRGVQYYRRRKTIHFLLYPQAIFCDEKFNDRISSSNGKISDQDYWRCFSFPRKMIIQTRLELKIVRGMSWGVEDDAGVG